MTEKAGGPTVPDYDELCKEPPGEKPTLPRELVVPHICNALGMTPAELMALTFWELQAHLAYHEGLALARQAAYNNAER